MFETRVIKDNQLLLAGVAGACVLGGGYMLYRHLRPEFSHDGGENYFDIISNLDTCIRSAVGEEIEYAMLGGGASAALADPNTTIDIDRHRVIPPKDIKKPQFRKDTGTRADIDILVFSSDSEVIASVITALTPDKEKIINGTELEREEELAKPGSKLKVGVTGLRSAGEYEEKPKTLIGKALKMAKKDWVSHRLEGDGGVRTFAISDVRVDLPDDYFERWELELRDGGIVPILHPLIQVLCYTSRASHGTRFRDIEKVQGIIDNVGSLFDASLQWGKDHQTATLLLGEVVSPGIAAAAEFCNQKNELRWNNTKQRLGAVEAGVLASRIAIHRQLDTREIFVQFGQGGWLFDNVLSRFSGERQELTR